MTSPTQAHPLSAAIHDKCGGSVDFTEGPIDVGSIGRFEGSSLRFDGAAEMTVDFSRAEKDAPEVMPYIDSSDHRFLDRLEAAESILEDLQRDAGTGLQYSGLWGHGGPVSLFAGRIGSAARELSEALSSGEPESWEAGPLLRKFIGLGEGLTPSGDDFLVGLFAAIRCGEPGGRRYRTAEVLSRVLLADDSVLLSATNALSASFLTLAASGLFSRSLVDFARAVAGSGGDDDIDRTLDIMRSIGHSSGLDTAAGFLFGQRALLK